MTESQIFQIGKISLAIVFILSGTLPMLNQNASLLLLEPFTQRVAWQWLLFFGMVVMDIGLGLGALWFQRSWYWCLMFAVVLSYSIVIGIMSPALWLDPLGSLPKNISLLAWLWVMVGLAPKVSKSKG